MLIRCLEEGAEDFFLKPVQLSDVNKLRPHLMKGKAKGEEEEEEVDEQEVDEQEEEEQEEQEEEEEFSSNKRKNVEESFSPDRTRARFNGLEMV